MPRPPFRSHHHKNNHKKPFRYVPSPNSGAYAILVAMLKAEQSDQITRMTKEQILAFCNKYSQSRLVDNSKIWSCMKGLIDKSMIHRDVLAIPLYSLENEGRELARELVAMPIDESSSDTITNTDSNSQFLALNSQNNPYEPEVVLSESGQAMFELKAGTFDIVLLVDTKERIPIACPDNSFKIDYVSLACGDFLWVARPKNTPLSDRTRDLVLDYVIERKRMDDFDASVRDRRMEEQKFRLMNCGLRRPMYLIEDHGMVRGNKATLLQAVTNIRVRDGIKIERTKSAAHTNDFLIAKTRSLMKYFLSKDLRSCSAEKKRERQADKNEFMTFIGFQEAGSKRTNWTVREMFAKHLILIKGMSDKLVAVVIEKYPTIKALTRAYELCPSVKDRKNLLTKMAVPDTNRTIGPKLSERVYAAYELPSFVEHND